LAPGLGGSGDIQIPKELRDTLAQLAAPPTTALAEAGVLPLMNQLVLALEQIPKLIEEVRESEFGVPVLCVIVWLLYIVV
jgi:hypothetical protein